MSRGRLRPEEVGQGPREEKISSGAGLLFKGSGFYITDYRSENYKKSAKRAASDSKPAAKTEGKSETKAETKSESKAAPKAEKMKPARQVCALALSLLLFLLGSLTVARGQYSFTDQNSVSSISGQFMVTSTDQDAPFYRDPVLAANTNLVRLKTSLLAVAAERYRAALWQQLGIAPNASWSGRVFLHLHPARSLDETVFIKSDLSLNRWNYRVELPDMLSKTRFARAMTGVLLLELANRTPGPDGHGAELPDWLVDGLAQQILATEGDKVVLSAPLIKSGDRELPVNRINRLDRGLDPLARARLIVQTLPVLSFDQLSWPTDAQMDGEDGGAYWASAQLLQAELLGLKNGKDKLRAMLAELPRHYNWQTAFFDAFGHDFHSPLDLEKWWALRMVNFASRAPGPRWTTDVSLARLEELMSGARGISQRVQRAARARGNFAQDALKNLAAAQPGLDFCAPKSATFRWCNSGWRRRSATSPTAIVWCSPSASPSRRKLRAQPSSTSTARW